MQPHFHQLRYSLDNHQKHQFGHSRASTLVGDWHLVQHNANTNDWFPERARYHYHRSLVEYKLNLHKTDIAHREHIDIDHYLGGDNNTNSLLRSSRWHKTSALSQ